MLAQVGEQASSKSAMIDLRAGVQRIDHHLAVDGAGDLDAAIHEVGGQRRDLPGAVAHGSRLRQEIGQRARVEAALHVHAAGEQVAAGGVEFAMQIGDEAERVGGEDFL